MRQKPTGGRWLVGEREAAAAEVSRRGRIEAVALDLPETD